MRDNGALGRFTQKVRLQWDSTPLRVRLTGTVLLLVAGSLVLISTTAIFALHTYFLSNVDSELEARLTQLNISEIDQTTQAGDNIRPNQYYFIVQYADGEQISRPADLTAAPQFDNADLSEADGEAFTVMANDSSVRWRVLGVTLADLADVASDSLEDSGDSDTDTAANATTDDGTSDGPSYLVLAYKLEHFDRSVAGLVWVVVLVSIGVLVLLAFLGAGLVKASLSPLRQIETTAAIIASGNYSRRVPSRDSGTEAGRVGVAINSMLKKIEVSIREREYSEERAIQSEQRMREFIADASHELRTPLTSVRGYAELVRSNPNMPEEDRLYYVKQIEDSSIRMGLLVSDLLLLARMDQMRPVDLVPLRLQILVADAVTAAQTVAPEHHFDYVELTEEDFADRGGKTELSADRGGKTELSADGRNKTESGDGHAEPEISDGTAHNITIDGDRARLRQVIDNLLNNATRHTPAGTTITVSLSKVRTSQGAPNNAIISVADNGPGMSETDRQRVFERFYRSAGPVNRTGYSTGHGLGLAIVAAIVKAHHGTVSVDSAEGKGSIFTVTLPCIDDTPEAKN